MAPRAQISAAVLQRVIDAAREALPNEATGMLVADRTFAEGGTPSRYVPLTNAAGSPYRFHADPAEQLREMMSLEATGEVVWGIVHSHLASAAVPSATDLRLAFYPQSLYLICSLAGEVPDTRAWSIRDGAATLVPLSIT
jgi:[CysO sulfur-carrier protein]-S-L-cysteine hydrolase